MKIVCDKCQTKYSIADEKVSGKVFKIRCKKCSHIIVVKGTGANPVVVVPQAGEADATVAGSAEAPLGAAAVAPAAAADAGAPGSVWFVVVNGEQVGPLGVDELRGLLDKGDIDAETYTWREGFGDWLRLASVDELRDVLGGAATGASANGAGGGETRRTDLGDVFGAHGEPASPDLFKAPAAAARSAPVFASATHDDLFAAAPAAVEARPGRGTPAQGAQASGGDSKLTGQRNENSMLFSLNNLSAMANAQTSTATPARSTPLERGAGFATAKNEGSGLIDIRQMAAATLSSAGMGAGAGHDAGDIPSFSAAPVFTPVVAAPVMLPAPPQSGMPRWALAVIGAMLLVLAGVVGLIVVLLGKKEPTPPPVVATTLTASPSVVGNPGAGTVAPPPTPAPTPAPAPAPAVAAAPESAKAEAPRAAAAPARGGRHAAAETKRGGGRTVSPVAAPIEPVRATAAAPSPTRKPRGGDSSIDDLINGAAPGDSAPRPRAAPRAEAPPPPADDPSLPERLDKPDVVNGMNAIKPRVMACYQQYHVPGVAMVHLTISRTGKVQAAEVQGALEGTPTGDCVARAVKSGMFRKSKTDGQSIMYPFVLR